MPLAAQVLCTQAQAVLMHQRAPGGHIAMRHVGADRLVAVHAPATEQLGLEFLRPRAGRAHGAQQQVHRFVGVATVELPAVPAMSVPGMAVARMQVARRQHVVAQPAHAQLRVP